MTEHSYSAGDALPITLLHDEFGEEVTLVDNGDEVVYTILREFALGGSHYAVLSPSDRSEVDDYVLFRIVRDSDGGLELETVDDDEEWEAVAEVYDELTFEP